MERGTANQSKRCPGGEQRKKLILFLTGLLVLLIPAVAYAQAVPEIASVICTLYGWLRTPTGDAVIMSALIALGVGTAYGKVSKGAVLAVVCGAGLIYGSGPLVVFFMPSLNGKVCNFTPDSFTFTCTNGKVDIDPGTGHPYNIFNANAVMSGLTADPVQQVFAHTLFVFKETIGAVMSSMYCSIAYEMQTPVMVLFSTFIIVHGLLLALGISKLSIRDLGIFFFKLALIYVFITDATWGIGIGYKFFMNFAEEGTNIVLDVLPIAPGSNKGALAVTSPDAITANLLTTSSSGTHQNSPLCTMAEINTNINAPAGTLVNPDSCTCANLGQIQYIEAQQQAGTVTNSWICQLPVCNSAAASAGEPCIASMSQVPQFCIIIIFVLAFLLLWFMPFLIIFIVLLILKYIMSFAKAMLNYLTSLVLISFLFILSPFFLTFALFRTTMPLFEGWLKHLISFSLQMIIMFAFMAMLTLLPFTQLFVSMFGLLKEYDHAFDFGFTAPVVGNIQLATFTLHFCGVCQYFTTPATALNMSQIACTPHPFTIAAGQTYQQAQAAAAAAAAQNGYMLSLDNNYWLSSMWNLTRDSGLFKYFVIQIIALYVLTKVLGDFMNKAPQYAKHLGGAAAAAAIGGGGGAQNGPGISYPGLESVGAAYYGLKNGLLAGSIRNQQNVVIGSKWNAETKQYDPVYGKVRVGLRDRLRYGFMGMDEKHVDATTGKLYSSPVAGVGMFTSLLKGAHDEHSYAGRAWSNQMRILEQRRDKALRRGDSNNVRDYERELQDMRVKGAGNFKKGFFEQRSTKIIHEQEFNRLVARLAEAKAAGASIKELKRMERDAKKAGRQLQTLIHRSSLNVTEYGDETSQRIADWDQRHRNRKVYGEYLKDNPGNWYYGMKMPQDVYAVTLNHRIDSEIQKADRVVGSLQKAINGLKSPEARDRAQGDLNTAAMHLHNATSTEEVLRVRQMLNSIQASLPKE